MKLRWLLPLLFAIPAFAAGGACPSGANYLNLLNPTGAKVTLATAVSSGGYGLTSCYYVSTTGLDTNNGTSESTPFLHSPGMLACSNNCAAVTLGPGIGVIFEGGETWHFGNSGATPYSGPVTTCADNGNNAAGLCLDDINASSTNYIYYGVDPSWPSSGWSRPVLTADNPLCGLGNTPAGCTYNPSSACLPSSGSACTGIYYVSSCTYPNIGNTNNLVDIGFSEYIAFDDFELTGLCQTHNNQPSGFDDFVNYSSDNDPIFLTNIYIHGWSHLQFQAPNGQTPCHGVPDVCINIEAFHGNVTAAETGGIGESAFFNVVDGADSDPVGGWVGFMGSYNTAYNVFRYNSGSAPGTIFTYHDNLFEYMYGNGHANLIESAEHVVNAAIYNNVFRHAELTPYGDGGVILWFGPVCGPASPTCSSYTTTDYIFNNLAYDIGPSEYLNMGATGLTDNYGSYIFFNDTWQSDTAQSIFNCGVLRTSSTATTTNDHYIDDTYWFENSGTCSGQTTTTTVLCQSNTSGGTTTHCPTWSDANSSPHYDQYTSSETYAYSPIASTNSTVGQGTNVYSSNCGALTTAGLTAAAAACKSDLTYAVSYAGSGATPVWPARTVNSRPSSGAWDIGAYEFVSASSIPGLTFNGLADKGLAAQ
jgi:hypothetical protein